MRSFDFVKTCLSPRSGYPIRDCLACTRWTVCNLLRFCLAVRLDSINFPSRERCARLDWTDLARMQACVSAGSFCSIISLVNVSAVCFGGLMQLQQKQLLALQIQQHPPPLSSVRGLVRWPHIDVVSNKVTELYEQQGTFDCVPTYKTRFTLSCAHHRLQLR